MAPLPVATMLPLEPEAGSVFTKLTLMVIPEQALVGAVNVMVAEPVQPAAVLAVTVYVPAANALNVPVD